MDFTFSEDQLVFCDNVKQFLQNEVSADVIRASWDTETGRNDGLWQQMVELGLTAMLVPEQFGGLAMNELDFVLLAQECGRVALPEPLVDTALVATPLLASLAQADQRCANVLEKIAAALEVPIQELFEQEKNENINGYIEIGSEIFKVTSFQDIENLLTRYKQPAK